MLIKLTWDLLSYVLKVSKLLAYLALQQLQA